MQQVYYKKAFIDFVEKVTDYDYKARHEFVLVGRLPDYVMADSAIVALEPMSNEIYVSDYQLRHSQRPEKSVPLSLEDLTLLPSKLEIARWFYDSSHNNLIATFDVLSELDNDIGKAAIKIKALYGFQGLFDESVK
ncbi:MAG: hypothetical protein QG557_344 [Pseudomonadota bacterium]|nr:hypothetical protein [Pseudomonadota bacterium]